MISMTSAKIHSIQVGRARPIGAAVGGEPGPGDEQPSAIVKEPLRGRFAVHWLGLAGDEVADHRHHGGPDQALLSYGFATYDAWRVETGIDECGPGWMGENLTIEGLQETNVCIGDQWQIGDVAIEVTKPRVPCWKLARRWGRPSMAADVIHTARPGWYSRVLTEGEVAPGDQMTLVARPHPDWTVARLFLTLYDREALRESLAEIEAMSVIGVRGLESIRARAAG
jgi:MOSC domain-containing protein YiiM